VKLGHVSIDGTKIKANASKHKAMSYARMGETGAASEGGDRSAAETGRGCGCSRGRAVRQGQARRSVAEELARRESRLKKIAQAKAELEQEAREKAERERAEAEAKLAERREQQERTGKK